MKIAIIGFGPSKNEAPIGNPEWQCWGVSWDESWEKYDVLFEMHSRDVLNIAGSLILKEVWTGKEVKIYANRPANYGGILGKCAKNKTLYMHKGYIPGAIPYPFEKVIRIMGDYFVSSISYMLGLALLKMLNIRDKEHEIGLYGVDVSPDEEWAYQRASTEYLIGLARGHGIKVTIPDKSSLLKYMEVPVRFGAVDIVYQKRYGLLGDKPQEFRRWVDVGGNQRKGV